MRQVWLTVVVFCLIAGCAKRSWRVSVPQEITAIPTDSFYAFPVKVVSGCCVPGVATKVTARCVDPAICEARVVPGEVHVIGKQTGSTTVVVDAENPIYKDNEHHTIPVVVTAPPPSRPALELGAALPAGSDLVHRVSGADVAHCAPSTAFASSITGSEQSDVHVYACSTYTDIDNERRFRSCDGDLCSHDDSYILCTQESGGVIAGVAVMELDEGQFSVRSLEGTLAPGVCAARL
jgi:hypothetical protein